MATNNPYSNYARQGIMTASPGELTLMLYDGAIKFIKRAKLSIAEKNFDSANEQIKRAEAIVMELINTLDFNYVMADGLLSLYDFINHELLEANMTKDEKRLDELIPLITDMRDTWQQAIRLNRKIEYSQPVEEIF